MGPDMWTTFFQAMIGLIVAITGWLNYSKMLKIQQINLVQNKKLDVIEKQTNGVIDRVASESKEIGFHQGKQAGKIEAAQDNEKIAELTAAKMTEPIVKKVVTELKRP